MYECMRIGTDNIVHPCDTSYNLRPETVESLFVLYRFTGLQKYRDYAWKIFKSIEKYCKTPNGFVSISNANQENSNKKDEQDSYFLAETLKYLYLIFDSSDNIPTTEYIFNTEAHPIHVWSQQELDSIKSVLERYYKE